MRKVSRDEVWDAVHQGGQARAPTDALPRFKAGDRIVVRRINPVGHTRLPRFVRGCEGTVQEQRGSFVFPDTRAHGLGDNPQHIYSVKFTARELWGDQAEGKDAVYLDLWDDYIAATGADR